jgi:hypothetical protein
LLSFFGIGGIFFLIALVDFIRRRPDMYWLFIILLMPTIGPILYIALEMLPSLKANRGEIAWLERRRRLNRLQVEVRENPSPGNLEEIGMLYLDAGDYARAKDAYDRALAQRTDSIDTFYRRALCEVALEQFAEAERDLERVIRKEGNYDFGRALGLYAHCLAKTGDVQRAQIAFEEAAKINTTSEFMVRYAEFLNSQGRREEARQWAQRVLDKRPLMPAYQRRRERPWLRRAAQLA